MSVAALSKSLPKPQYSGEEEELTNSTRVLTAEQYEAQVVAKKGPPPYGQRQHWRPRAPEGKAWTDEMHAKHALTLYLDFIPLRQQADAGELDLSRPSADVVQATKEKTEQALMALVQGQTAAQKPKNVQGRKNDEPTFVRYTPTAQHGQAQGQTRIIKIQQRQIDPMEPPKFKHKRIPRGPPSPPPPVLHSPPRKLTAEDQELWKIPPPISNWKNPKGYSAYGTLRNRHEQSVPTPPDDDHKAIRTQIQRRRQCGSE